MEVYGRDSQLARALAQRARGGTTLSGISSAPSLDYLKKYGRKYCHVLYTRFSLASDAPHRSCHQEAQCGRGYIAITHANGLMLAEITTLGLKRLEEHTY